MRSSPVITFEKSWHSTLVIRKAHIERLIATVTEHLGEAPAIRMVTRDGATVEFDSGAFDSEHPLAREIVSLEIGSERSVLSSTSMRILVRRALTPAIDRRPELFMTASVSIRGRQDDSERALTQIERVIDEMVPWYGTFFGLPFMFLGTVLLGFTTLGSIGFITEGSVPTIVPAACIAASIGLATHLFVITRLLPPGFFAVGRGEKAFDDRMTWTKVILGTYFTASLAALGLIGLAS